MSHLCFLKYSFRSPFSMSSMRTSTGWDWLTTPISLITCSVLQIQSQKSFENILALSYLQSFIADASRRNSMRCFKPACSLTVFTAQCTNVPPW